MSDGNVFKMAAPSTVYMCESLTKFFQFQDVKTFDVGIIRNDLPFGGFYRCVNTGESLTNVI